MTFEELEFKVNLLLENIPVLSGNYYTEGEDKQ